MSRVTEAPTLAALGLALDRVRSEVRREQQPRTVGEAHVEGRGALLVTVVAAKRRAEAGRRRAVLGLEQLMLGLLDPFQPRPRLPAARSKRGAASIEDQPRRRRLERPGHAPRVLGRQLLDEHMDRW
jgi:hypothetical protein